MVFEGDKLSLPTSKTLSLHRCSGFMPESSIISPTAGIFTDVGTVFLFFIVTLLFSRASSA
jgi:hypothetical protein